MGKKKEPIKKVLPNGKLNAHAFRFEKVRDGSLDPFAVFRKQEVWAVEDVEFDDDSLNYHYDLHTNVYEHAAVKLNDGTFLFCIVDGSRFVDTFSSNEKIKMEYYRVTEIDNAA